MRPQASESYLARSHRRESVRPQRGRGVCTNSRSTRPPATRNSVARLPPHSESIKFTKEPVLLAEVALRETRAKLLNSTQRSRCSPRNASLKALNNARRSTVCTLGICSAASSAVWCAMRGNRSADFMTVACHDSRRAMSADLK